MEKAEIKHIGDYLKDLEEGLYEWDYRGIAPPIWLPNAKKTWFPRGLRLGEF